MLKDKMLLKVKNQVSKSESIEDIDSLIDESISEADDLIKSKEVGESVRFDIAYYRFLLFVRQNSIKELDLKMYEKALELVSKAPFKQTTPPSSVSHYGRVGQRREF